MTTGGTIRVLIADDQQMVRQGFTVLLNAHPGIEVVGQAVDGCDAVAKVAELAPDVVLMDIRMPELGGIDATRRDHARPPAHQGAGAHHLRPRRVRVRGAARRRVRLPAQGRLRPTSWPRRSGWWPPGTRCWPRHHPPADRRVLPSGRQPAAAAEGAGRRR